MKTTKLVCLNYKAEWYYTVYRCVECGAEGIPWDEMKYCPECGRKIEA